MGSKQDIKHKELGHFEDSHAGDHHMSVHLEYWDQPFRDTVQMVDSNR
jgi:hypothetical protein